VQKKPIGLREGVVIFTAIYHRMFIERRELLKRIKRRRPERRSILNCSMSLLLLAGPRRSSSYIR
jgi:hypothetical protein